VPSSGSGVSRRVRDAGSYTHAVDDTAEVQCVAYDRIFEREVGDPNIQGVSASEAEFHGASLLGTGVVREYGWIR